MYFKLFISAIIICLTLSNCTSSLYTPNETDAQLANTSLDTLLVGRKLYINNCSNCHNLYLPTNYTNSEWQSIMNNMQQQAKIDEKQKNIITKYLIIKSKK
ncbi:MAG: hypothetical protein HY951_00435 [Bacteroidia bacterium]|nr:hypothetical protein [Bacteroidia bacterium]